MYTLKAWLPETDHFVARLEDGTFGLLTSEGFEPQPTSFLASACSKHYYLLLKQPVQVNSPSEVSAVAAELMKSLGLSV